MLMRRAFSDDLRYALSSLVREPSFTAPAVVSLALGVGVAVSILALFRLDSLVPLGLSAAIAPEYVRDPGWSGSWSQSLWPPASLQAAHFQNLLEVLGVVSTLALAVGCATVIVLALIRASTRTPEMALRVAVGASTRRLLSGLLAEGLVLASLGALLGIGLGFAGASLVRASWPHGLEMQSGFDPHVLLVAITAPLLVVVPFSLIAVAGVVRRSDLSGALVAGADGTGSKGELILQDFLAIVQLAVSIALVIGAGLLIRNASAGAESTPAGYDAGDVVTFQLDLPASRYADESTRAAAYEELLARVGGLEGIEAESLSTPGAWFGIGSLAPVTAQCGRCYRSGIYLPVMPGFVRLHAVSSGFFRARGIHLLEGRDFAPADGMARDRVMVVNRTFADSHFERGKPLGRMVQIGGVDDPWHTVVGVVEDAAGQGIGASVRPAPVAYIPVLQASPLSTDLAIIVGGDRQRAVVAMRRALAGLVAEGKAYRESTLEADTMSQAAPFSWFGLVLAAVGVLALVIAMHGAHAVMRFKVSRRRREIGVIRALGARRRRIVLLVVLQSLGVISVGVALGVWGALLLAGWLDMLVPGLRAFDVGLYGGSILLMSAAALLGGSIAVRQATSIQPAAAMGAE
jgi:putative ABC transport system permease protein